MLKIENLNFKYEEKRIFKNASFEVPKGKISIILGLNGAGKSTLLKIITNNIKADCKIENDFKETFYLPQNPYYPIGMSVFDYVSSVYFKNNWKWFLNAKEKQKTLEILNMVELSDKKDMEVQNLSAGEAQKANFALGLLSGADLFLLDEPLSNMDLINVIKILSNLKTLSHQGITSVMAAHDINSAANFGDYFIGIDNEGEILTGERDEFFTAENLRKIYGINFKIIKDENKIYIQTAD